jgi:lauroyl/myristoyl acyltransferase
MWRYVLFWVSAHTLGRLPIWALYPLCDLLGELAYWLCPGRRRHVWHNLRHILGPQAHPSQLRRLARRTFRNVARYYGDLVHMPYLDVRRFYQSRLVHHGFEEHFLPALAQGRGVIILSAHLGNPELAVQGLLFHNIRVVALTEPLHPPRLSRLVDRLRSSKGHTFLPVGVGGVKAAVQALRRGGVVALMGDRDIQGPRAPLPFFGREANMPTGPMEMALRTGATVLPIFCHRRGPRLEVFIEPPLELVRSGSLEEDVRLNTLRFLNRLEEHLRKDPAQWIVLEPVWDTDGDKSHGQG